MTSKPAQELGAFVELVTCVRTAMILDVMHEFLATEVQQDSFLWNIWYAQCERNQTALEALFEHVNAYDAARRFGEDGQNTGEQPL